MTFERRNPSVIAGLIVFLIAYTINLLYISIFYHRALAHRALMIPNGLERFVVATGPWVSGLDPKGWVCMHRMHHSYSDTPKDPHSPVQHGTFYLMVSQLHSYERTLRGLIVGRSQYTSVVADLPFSVNQIYLRGLWFLPYLVHLGLSLGVATFFGMWFLAACYFVGIMSHPVQGWLVNSLGHRYGYRNFETPDNSRNNTLVSWLVFGEGFQNNHHQNPRSPKFSVRWWEIDPGYWLCQCLKVLRIARY